MKGQMQIYYDEEGDYLEVNIGKYTKGYFKDIGEGVAKRIDEKTGKVTGIAVLGFRKRTKELKGMKINLPVKLEISA